MQRNRLLRVRTIPCMYEDEGTLTALDPELRAKRDSCIPLIYADRARKVRERRGSQDGGAVEPVRPGAHVFARVRL